jgi:hypothetical protein
VETKLAPLGKPFSCYNSITYRSPKMAETTTGKTITNASLKKSYGEHAPLVLMDYLQKLPKEKKGERDKYRVLKELPDKETFMAMKIKKFTTNIESFVSDALGEFEVLKEELQEWYDNMPEGLQNGEKGETVQSAIDGFDTIELPSFPDELAKLEITYIPPEKIGNKADRRDEAVSRLHHAIDALNDEMDEDICSAARKELIETLIEEIDQCIGEADNVELSF